MSQKKPKTRKADQRRRRVGPSLDIWILALHTGLIETSGLFQQDDKGGLDMGASSSKRTFFWQKKKKRAPLERAWGRLKGALPNKKRKRKSILEGLKRGTLKKIKFKKRFSVADNKEPELFKRFSLGNRKKGVRDSKSKEETRGSQRRSKDKEKTPKKGEAPSPLEESSQQDAKKTDKSESQRAKTVWKSK